MERNMLYSLIYSKMDYDLYNLCLCHWIVHNIENTGITNVIYKIEHLI